MTSVVARRRPKSTGRDPVTTIRAAPGLIVEMVCRPASVTTRTVVPSCVTLALPGSVNENSGVSVPFCWKTTRNAVSVPPGESAEISSSVATPTNFSGLMIRTFGPAIRPAYTKATPNAINRITRMSASLRMVSPPPHHVRSAATNCSQVVRSIGTTPSQYFTVN